MGLHNMSDASGEHASQSDDDEEHAWGTVRSRRKFMLHAVCFTLPNGFEVINTDLGKWDATILQLKPQTKFKHKANAAYLTMNQMKLSDILGTNPPLSANGVYVYSEMYQSRSGPPRFANHIILGSVQGAREGTQTVEDIEGAFKSVVRGARTPATGYQHSVITVYDGASEEVMPTKEKATRGKGTKGKAPQADVENGEPSPDNHRCQEPRQPHRARLGCGKTWRYCHGCAFIS